MRRVYEDVKKKRFNYQIRLGKVEFRIKEINGANVVWVWGVMVRKFGKRQRNGRQTNSSRGGGLIMKKIFSDVFSKRKSERKNWLQKMVNELAMKYFLSIKHLNKTSMTLDENIK